MEKVSCFWFVNLPFPNGAGWVDHQFEGAPNASYTLSARARQFSSFLVLVGRISGPRLFDPQFGIIVQNKVLAFALF